MPRVHTARHTLQQQASAESLSHSRLKGQMIKEHNVVIRRTLVVQPPNVFADQMEFARRLMLCSKPQCHIDHDTAEGTQSPELPLSACMQLCHLLHCLNGIHRLLAFSDTPWESAAITAVRIQSCEASDVVGSVIRFVIANLLSQCRQSLL